MDNNIYKQGIDFAVEQMLKNENKFKEVSEKIKNEQGEEAYKEFINGYYKALTYFTHAVSHFKDSPEHLEEKINGIEDSQGEDIKNAFLEGIEYYKMHEDELPYYQRKK